MGIYAIKPRFQKLLWPVKDFCILHRITPTVLNIVGLCCSLALAYCIVQAQLNAVFLLAIPVFALLRTASNALDGMVAREQNVASVQGELQNEFFDRCSDIIIFSAFLFVYGVVPFLVLVVVSGILLASFLGVLAKNLVGQRIYSGIMGKADRMLYLGIAGIVQFFVPTIFVWNIVLFGIALGLMETVVSRYIKIYRNNNLLL